jgi:hypothetical protein
MESPSFNVLLLCGTDASAERRQSDHFIAHFNRLGLSVKKWYLGLSSPPQYTLTAKEGERHVGDVRDPWPNAWGWPERFDLIIDEFCPREDTTGRPTFSLGYLDRVGRRLKEEGHFAFAGHEHVGTYMEIKETRDTRSSGKATRWIYVRASNVPAFFAKALYMEYRGKVSYDGGQHYMYVFKRRRL